MWIRQQFQFAGEDSPARAGFADALSPKPSGGGKPRCCWSTLYSSILTTSEMGSEKRACRWFCKSLGSIWGLRLLRVHSVAVSHDPFSMSQHLQDKKRIYKPGKSQYALECILWPIGSSLTLFEIWERGADVPLGCLGGQSALPWSAENFHGGRSVSYAHTDESGTKHKNY